MSPWRHSAALECIIPALVVFCCTGLCLCTDFMSRKTAVYNNNNNNDEFIANKRSCVNSYALF